MLTFSIVIPFNIFQVSLKYETRKRKIEQEKFQI